MAEEKKDDKTSSDQSADKPQVKKVDVKDLDFQALLKNKQELENLSFKKILSESAVEDKNAKNKTVSKNFSEK